MKFNICCMHKSFLYRYINFHTDIFYSVVLANKISNKKLVEDGKVKNNKKTRTDG